MNEKICGAEIWMHLHLGSLMHLHLETEESGNPVLDGSSLSPRKLQSALAN